MTAARGRHGAVIGRTRARTFSRLPAVRGLDSVRLGLDRIRGAVSEIDPVFLDTPALSCAPLGEALGCSVTLKVETLNPVRSFKGRGTETVAAVAQRERMRALYEHAGLVVEPSAALGVAAVVEHQARFAGRRVTTILCGSNVAAADFARWVLEPATRNAH
jgi:threonine dehydratase